MSEELYRIYREGTSTKDEAVTLARDIVKTGIDPDETQKRYDLWASNFDKDVVRLDWIAPRMIAEELGSYLRENKSAKILDCAAGTGLVGLHLNEQGYTNIDALDLSTAMLEVAKKKGFYTNLIRANLGQDKLDIPDNTYDGLTVSGAFYEGHVRLDCLPELVRIVKPGGFIVLGIRELNLVTAPNYVNMEILTDNMVKCGMWRQLMRKIQPNYFNGDAGIIWCFAPI